MKKKHNQYKYFVIICEGMSGDERVEACESLEEAEKEYEGWLKRHPSYGLTMIKGEIIKENYRYYND